MVKRKSDLEHTARTFYESGGTQSPMGVDGGLSSGQGNYDRVGTDALQSRRRATGAVPAGRGGGGGQQQDVRSAKHRRVAYLKGVSKLNRNFGTWAECNREDLVRSIERDGPAEGPPVFYYRAVDEYLRQAAALKERYQVSFGDVLCFGMGDMGQLGIPGKNPDEGIGSSSIPRVIKNLRDAKVLKVACGGLHNAAVDEDGRVYTWGCNDEGSLGKFDFSNLDQLDTAYVPQKVSGFLPSRSSPTYPTVSEYAPRTDEAIVDIATGDCQTLALSTTGNVYMFGTYRDKEGKLFRDATPPDETRIQQEKLIEDRITERFLEVNGNTADMREEAEFKRNKLAPRGKQLWPVHVYRLPRKAKAIDCGTSFNAALLIDGTMVTWGLGECGELGRKGVPDLRNNETKEYNISGIQDCHLKPLEPMFDGPKLQRMVESVSCGAYHIMVVAKDNVNGVNTLRVYTSGLNNYGQLGHGDYDDRDILTRVTFFDDCNIHKVAGGQHHSLALGVSGQNLYGFGRGDSGQLGITDEIPKVGYCENSPVPITISAGRQSNGNDNGEDKTFQNPTIVQIAAGSNHNLVLTNESDVYTWGYGDACALGHGGDADEFRPRKLDIMADLKKKLNGKGGAASSNLTATVRQVVGGGQHSALIATRSSVV